MVEQRRDGHLLAVLLNPPSSTSGQRTILAVCRAAAVLGYDGCKVTNLFAEATPTVIELSGLAFASDSWVDARRRISEQLRVASGVLAAWGVARVSRTFQQGRESRAAWLRDEAARQRHDSIWMVGAEPRHPSRWHQFVADKHGHCLGGTFEERLAQVLASVPSAPSPVPAN